MKKLIIAFAIAALVSCNDSTETKTETGNDSTVLPLDTNSNKTDTQSVIDDSSKVDSSHIRPDAPTNQ